ncbi:MAG: hypothetical protein K0B07_03290 [DPANN group archaeon]|nr:hypothetical protein [DPANN group archaeon]
MSEYFITDKNRINSIIPFGFKDFEEEGARIYASVIKHGLNIKPFYGVDKIELDIEKFYEFYDEF